MIKKILLVTSWYPVVEKPQSGIFFKIQAELLSEKYDVKVLVCDTIPIGRKGLVKSILKKPKSKYNYIKSDKFKVLNLDIPEYVFLNEKNRYKKLFSNFTTSLLKLFASWKPDVIHAHDVWLAGVVAKSINEKAGIPYAITSHTPILFNTNNSFINTLFLEAIKKANQFITVGNQDKRIVESIIDLKPKAITIGNIIDTELFNPKNKINLNNTFKIIQITSTSLRKDLPTFLKAIKHFFDVYEPQKEIEVVLVVSSIQNLYSKHQLEKDIRELNLENIITLKSNILNADIAKELSNCDLCISTSFYETFGLTVAEATAMGVPTISVDNGAVRDFITPFENGLIVEIADYKKIAEYINKIYTQEIVFDKNKLHQSISNKYSKGVYLNKLETIYNTITQ